MMSPQDPVGFANLTKKMDQKMMSAGRDGRQNSKSPRFNRAGGA